MNSSHLRGGSANVGNGLTAALWDGIFDWADDGLFKNRVRILTWRHWPVVKLTGYVMGRC